MVTRLLHPIPENHDPRKSYRLFEMNYFGRMVWSAGIGWDGYVVRVNLNDDDPMSMAYHSTYLLYKHNGQNDGRPQTSKMVMELELTLVF